MALVLPSVPYSGASCEFVYLTKNDQGDYVKTRSRDDGVTRVLENWTLTYTDITPAQAEQLRQFFIERGSTSTIFFTPPGAAVAMLFVNNDTFQAEHVEFNSWNCSVVFEEVVDPE